MPSIYRECRWVFFLIFATGLLALISCNTGEQTPSKKVQANVWFHDATAASGIDFAHERGPTRYWLPEITSGGGGWIDYDNDGDLDAYLLQSGDLKNTGNGPGNVLYENLGDGKFKDVTSVAGVGHQGYGMGLAVGDYDGDGNLDIYVTNFGKNVLYRNRGDKTFEEVTDYAHVGHDGWGTGATFVDYDQDGDMDLFVANYINWIPEREEECVSGDGRRDYCLPKTYQYPSQDTLYRNNGDGTFEDISSKVGLDKAFGNGFGVVSADFNLDGRLDFYVANDGNPNQLWIQDGDGKFVDEALSTGCSVNRMGVAEAGMGVAAIDIENDGDLDLFMTHVGTETNTLYVNENGFFDDATAVHGLAASSINFTGFGLGFADFDNDGLQDLYVANGRVGRSMSPLDTHDVFAEPNQLFRGRPTGRFEEVVPRGATCPLLLANSRAAAFGDYDLDGDVDILIVNNHGKARLLSNEAASIGNWIRFRVRSRFGQDAIGARVRITVDGKEQWRIVSTSYSFQSSNEPALHFGLGQASSVEDVSVFWNDGSSTSFGSKTAGTLYELKQGRSQGKTASSGLGE